MSHLLGGERGPLVVNSTKLLLCVSGKVALQSGRLSRYASQERFGETINNKARIVALRGSGGNHKVTEFRAQVGGRVQGSRHGSTITAARRARQAKISPHPSPHTQPNPRRGGASVSVPWHQGGDSGDGRKEAQTGGTQQRCKNKKKASLHGIQGKVCREEQLGLT